MYVRPSIRFRPVYILDPPRMHPGQRADLFISWAINLGKNCPVYIACQAQYTISPSIYPGLPQMYTGLTNIYTGIFLKKLARPICIQDNPVYILPRKKQLWWGRIWSDDVKPMLVAAWAKAWKGGFFWRTITVAKYSALYTTYLKYVYLAF